MAARTWSAAEKFRNNMTNKPKNIMPLIAAFTVIAATGAFAHNPNGKVDAMNASLEPLKGAEFEQSFLQQMIQDRRSADEMTKMVPDHTQRAELRHIGEKSNSWQQ